MRIAARQGFTLIELMLVVVIVGLLAAFAIPKYGNAKQHGRRAAGKADLHRLVVQQERFYSDAGRYGSLADSAALRVAVSRGNSGFTITLAGEPAGVDGFNATLTIPGKETCGVFVAKAARPTGMPNTSAPAAPVCW